MENLISKRELLKLYGISYGALYRWKRRGLIPEDWFIKTATATGQETFLPRELVCERIELILKQKDESTLSSLRERLDGEELERAQLIIETKYGKKCFFIDEISKVMIENSTNANDITEKIFGG